MNNYTKGNHNAIKEKHLIIKNNKVFSAIWVQLNVSKNGMH